ncbi:hypothetical protein OXX79_014241, partial [Metschnikowia pulcherrima]
MKEAEAAMREVAESVASQTVLDAPVPAQYSNLILSAPRPKSSPERKKTRIVKPILVAHSGPTIPQAQWDALLQQVAEQEKLFSEQEKIAAEVADIRDQQKRDELERESIKRGIAESQAQVNSGIAERAFIDRKLSEMNDIKTRMQTLEDERKILRAYAEKVQPIFAEKKLSSQEFEERISQLERSLVRSKDVSAETREIQQAFLKSLSEQNRRAENLQHEFRRVSDDQNERVTKQLQQSHQQVGRFIEAAKSD